METVKITATDYAKKDRKAADRLALAVFRAGFPESFEVEITSSHGNATIKFEIDEKKINDNKGYHQAIFKYDLARGMDKLLDKLGAADEDLETISYVDSLEVIAEFTNKFDKVWGSLG